MKCTNGVLHIHIYVCTTTHLQMQEMYDIYEVHERYDGYEMHKICEMYVLWRNI